ncbi:MAG TPA: hypothetical protein DEB47_18275 [Citreicella sp.]|nr:hypothetical protein [Citreicella sp.]
MRPFAVSSWRWVSLNLSPSHQLPAPAPPAGAVSSPPPGIVSAPAPGAVSAPPPAPAPASAT